VTRSSTDVLNVALLHLAPLPGQIAHNRNLIEKSIHAAAAAGANWIVTPELAVCGYAFAEHAGTDWIVPQPDNWMSRICELAARLHVTIFLSTPERDAHTNKLRNAVFVIADNGHIAGSHRKINTLRVGAEAWSSPGDTIAPIAISPFRRVGILICSDAYSPPIAERMREIGAELFVSPAAWAPGLHGPNGEWERVTVDTSVPLFVCNQTGHDAAMNFTDSVSTVVQNGQRLLSLSSEVSKLFLISWDVRARALASRRY
jgi:omega-amidase